ncbi:hypothetical protein SISNIDRAFT_488254 [Sistotremastrum niveocremeum HHB9708]|uniref:Uncharacterized protein n=1 Tax=Sistotremastrum niveocremeum HHB9708 TaxID=1314777 RepID=A0A164RM66_9AGAM|nr:hypothetical protein SISNIDRAFT_488254 [Sistotremastrum niveocremeum HHB9708]
MASPSDSDSDEAPQNVDGRVRDYVAYVHTIITLILAVQKSTDPKEVPNQPPNLGDQIRATLGSLGATLDKEAEEFYGVYACSQTFTDAPSPGIDIKGYGRLPLPLYERAAQEILELASSLSSLESTSNEAGISADQISFHNPKWDAWFRASVIREVKKRLSIDSSVKCELRELKIYGKGSTPFHNKDTEEPSSTFGTITVLLPSSFEGGELQLSHSSLTKTFSTSHNSEFQTSVIAQYNNVHVERDAITEGYQLALIYNLVADPGVKAPHAPDITHIVSKIRDALRSWKESSDDSLPEKLAYVLADDYESYSTAFKSRINPSSLNLDDIRVVDILGTLAEECGFDIYLAKAQLEVTGSAKRDDSDDVYCRDYHMGEISDSSLSIEKVVNLEGNKVDLQDFEFEHPQEFISLKLDDRAPVTTENDDERVYELLEDEEFFHHHDLLHDAAIELSEWYEGIVVIFWPSQSRDFVLGNDWLQVSVSKVLHSRSSSPTLDEQSLIKEIEETLGRQTTHTNRRVLRSICLTAMKWKALGLWQSVFRLSEEKRGDALLDMKELRTAASSFGFENVKEQMAAVLEKMPKKWKRDYEISSISYSELSKIPGVKDWCEEQRKLTNI